MDVGKFGLGMHSLNIVFFAPASIRAFIAFGAQLLHHGPACHGNKKYSMIVNSLTVRLLRCVYLNKPRRRSPATADGVVRCWTVSRILLSLGRRRRMLGTLGILGAGKNDARATRHRSLTVAGTHDWKHPKTKVITARGTYNRINGKSKTPPL